MMIDRKIVGSHDFNHKNNQVWFPDFSFNKESWIMVVIGIQIAQKID